MKYIDSNIFVYSVLARQAPEKHEIAKSIVAHPDVVIGLQVVNEMAAVLTTKSKMDHVEIRTIIEDMLLRYTVIMPAAEDTLLAFELRKRYRFQYWDSLHFALALRVGCSEFISEDMHNNLLVESQLRVRNPFL